MSGGVFCKCKPVERKNWIVLVRNGNYSYFERPQGCFHPSDYSELFCKVCGSIWRTKANYVSEIQDHTLEKWIAEKGGSYDRQKIQNYGSKPMQRKCSQ